jgi:hypothetical protein
MKLPKFSKDRANSNGSHVAQAKRRKLHSTTLKDSMTEENKEKPIIKSDHEAMEVYSQPQKEGAKKANDSLRPKSARHRKSSSVGELTPTVPMILSPVIRTKRRTERTVSVDFGAMSPSLPSTPSTISSSVPTASTFLSSTASDTTRLMDPPLHKPMTKKLDQRKCVLEELLASESDYVKDLENCITVYNPSYLLLYISIT